MKNLSIAEKAKRYDKAFEKVKENYAHAQFLSACEDYQISLECLKNTLESIFPELKESEEKPVEEYNITGITSGYATGKLKEIIKDIESGKVEKFKVGDWVVNKFGDVWHIDSFDKKNYQVSDVKGNYNYFPISKQDEMHLWTIADAKDGDILCTYECCEPKIVFILKGTPKKHYALSYHCYYNIMYPHFESNSEKGCLAPNDEDVHPATKEQRDLLFQEMKIAQMDSHDYVEIGGIKWATKNVGAKKITDSGLYFQWGDTQGYTAAQIPSEKDFSLRDYKYGNSSSTFTKYSETDGKTVLDSEDDAVTAAWGGNWRMPTIEEFQALDNATTNKWVSIDGVNGILFTSKDDSSKMLFFPATGNGEGHNVWGVGCYGCYWSRSLYTDGVTDALYLYIGSGGLYPNDYHDRYLGFPVRGVFGE